jgi:hypothetical protein
VYLVIVFLTVILHMLLLSSKLKRNLIAALKILSSSSQSVDTKVVRNSDNQGVSSLIPSSKYNILNQLANIKDYATLLDMVFIP